MATPKPDGRKKKRPGVDEQRQIIASAAIELFKKEGSKNTSIAQICRAADVSKPTFYRCFEDKEALISQLYQNAVNIHVENLLAFNLSDAFDHPEQINQALDRLIDAILEHSDIAHWLFREYSDPNSPASHIIDNTFEKIAGSMRHSLKKNGLKAPSLTFLKAMMSAFQWVVYDCIKHGKSPVKIKDTKAASRELASALFSQIR